MRSSMLLLKFVTSIVHTANILLRSGKLLNRKLRKVVAVAYKGGLGFENGTNESEQIKLALRAGLELGTARL